MVTTFENSSVLVCGASIAGNTLAYCLGRHGFDVTVVERWPALRPGGQAVDLRGVSRDVVREMGLDEPIRAALTDTEGASFVTARGRKVATIRADQFNGNGLITDVEVLRGDLAKVLHDAAAPRAEYLFGNQVVELSQDARGVDVRLQDDTRRRFDLVIGADGLHSATRAAILGQGKRFRRYLGHHVAFFTVPNRLGLDHWMEIYVVPGRTVAVRSIRGNSEAMAFLTLRTPQLEYDHHDLDEQRMLLREHFAGVGWETPWLLERMDDAPDFYFDSAAQVRLPRWSVGRVALVGDAAFCPSPLSGQGTSLAVVGAYVLAGELAAADGDHEVAFDTYRRTLRHYVEANQGVGQKFERTSTPRNRRGVVLQYAAIAGLSVLPFPTFGDLQDAASALDLKRYPFRTAA